MNKCVIVIGHNEKAQGAKNITNDMSEYRLNSEVARQIYETLNGIDIYDRGVKYTSPHKEINNMNPDFVLSLHCNAFNTTVHGTETLYWHSSGKGKKIAKIVQEELLNSLELKDRGLKSISGDDRGSYILKNTNAPCIIAEPFFIDNDEEYKKISIEDLVNAYVHSIERIREEL